METKIMKKLGRSILVALGLALALAPAAWASGYTFVDIDYPLSGATTTLNDIRGLNNLGQIVGSYTLGGRQYSFIKNGETYKTLDISGTNHFAWGINDNGQVVGQVVANNTWLGYIYDTTSSSYTDIKVPWSWGTAVYGINDAGQICGYYNNNGRQLGFMHDLNTKEWIYLDKAGATSTWAFGINDARTIVGDYIKDGHNYGYTYDGTFLDLNVPGFQNTRPVGINDHGDIVGRCWNDGGTIHGFVYRDGKFETLDMPGAEIVRVIGINNAGQIVGVYTKDGGTTYHGFLGTPVKPIANAGSNQTVHAGATVNLDGSGSYDPGGNTPLTYAWTFKSMPAGSSAKLSDPNAVSPWFLADLLNAGDWVLELVITDSKGAKSDPASVTISTRNSAPLAEAGPDQAVTVIGSTVNLNGSGSYDPDGDTLTYTWKFTSYPGDNPPTLAAEETVTPSFVAGVHADYELELKVSDPWGASATDKVKISFANVKPVANAGSGQSVVIGDMVTLNGSGSTDANLDPLTYKWNLAAVPADSSQGDWTAATMTAAFKPDVPGDYVVQLVVNDGFVDSDGSTAQIHVAASRNWVTEKLRNLIADIGNIGYLPDDAFKNKNMRNTLINKLNAVIATVDARNYQEAITKLQDDVLAKTNGCAGSTPPAPDKNDWIVKCDYQGMIYPELQEIITHLSELLDQPTP
jgi:probable HAF family extracellular repeat protein